MGHVESRTLAECRSEEEALERLGRMSLLEVQQVLMDAVAEADGNVTLNL